jgi:molybdenum cofactor biosynthesis enzyme MoaA
MKVIAELVDGCHLKCELCWNKDRRGSFKNMSLDTVKMVLKRYGKEDIDWYNWGEPLLHKDFVKFSEMIKGTRARVSSSLSLKLSDEKRKSLSNFFQVVVSLSGMTEEVYKRYHKGGNFGLVKKNLESLDNENVRVQWLEHPNNAHQLEDCKRYCNAIGVEMVYKGLNCEVEKQKDGFKHTFLKKYRSPRWYCYIKNKITIGADGEYLLCCASHNVRIGLNIRDNVTRQEIMFAKDKVKLCQECQERKLWKLY